jgi:hypothetical protein
MFSFSMPITSGARIEVAGVWVDEGSAENPIKRHNRTNKAAALVDSTVARSRPAHRLHTFETRKRQRRATMRTIINVLIVGILVVQVGCAAGARVGGPTSGVGVGAAIVPPVPPQEAPIPLPPPPPIQ